MERKSESVNIDVFTTNGMEPTSELKNQVLLFDNLDEINPLKPTESRGGQKLWQLTVFCLMEGRSILNINGKDVEINKGQILVTHEECMVEFKEASDDNKFFMYVIYPETVHETFNDIHLNYNKSQYSYSYCLGDMKPEDMEYFRDLYLDAKAEIEKPDYKYKYYYVKAILNILLVYIINKFYADADMKADPSSRQYDMFCKFMDALNKFADKERSVQYYADYLGITSKYLSFVCLQYSQKNASSWIDEYVVAKARALQNVHHYNIKRISKELNFISPSSFTRFFKRVTGAPPTK